MTTNILLSGFGGQGILFAGKQIAKTGMDTGMQVSWLPSYGPEMRGGTASCSVIVSDEEVGCPLVSAPDLLVCFNLPSFDKFEPTVAPGGKLFADSSLIDKQSTRTDIECFYIPASAMASDNGLTGGANVIMLGYILAKTGLFDFEEFKAHMVASIPQTKAKLIENNKKALDLGFHYAG